MCLREEGKGMSNPQSQCFSDTSEEGLATTIHIACHVAGFCSLGMLLG